ncbi:hypothetical protein GCM10023093_22810 [Nemorincola caseinilytica]|uniref:DUF1735 domain-containing protein n=1 Tax=Nemorincola caseinilytica TaxID=2054315 RepID=A0ABP8NKZ1_9BACT
MFEFYRRSVYILLIAFVISASWGCNIINPQEKIPTYIHIDSFVLDGGKLHDINNVTVYYDGRSVGSFDLPCTIPVITTGPTGKLELAPGILVNGRNDRPLTYPFYKMAISTLNEQPGKIVYLTPSTSYYDSVKVTVISDFEAGITKFAKWGGTTSLVAVTADSLKLEGTASGAVFLNTFSDSSIDSTIHAFPIRTGAAFIEFDYRSSTPFAIGLQAKLGTTYTSGIAYMAGIYPSDGWHKFYLNVTGFVSQYPADSYNMYIKAALDGRTSGRLLIDNIKLVTF